ncbi:MAG TPA: T9SS type A sorting domain-containing protein [Anaerovoracaceae bacterium]|nr:T9SS type A sorting domain-containing protein [Anaerovoracaceae bacterium]
MNLIRIILLLSGILLFRPQVIKSQNNSNDNIFPLINIDGKINHSINQSLQIHNPLQEASVKMTKSEEIVYRLNQNIRQNWDGTTWIDNWLYAYSYDANNNVIELSFARWNGDNWIDAWAISNRYDENNNNIEWINKRWDGEHWLNNSMSTSIFNENNKVTETINYIYQDQWRESSRLEYTYDDNGNVVEEISQMWGGVGNDVGWINQQMVTYSYDEENYPVEKISQLWYISYWANQKRDIYNYDESQNLIEHIAQVPEGSDWANNKRNAFKWDEKKLLEDLSQNWGGIGDDVGWINFKFHLYTYIGAKKSEHMYQEWSGSEWLNISKNIYTYSVDNLSEDLSLVWSDPNWEDDKKHLFTYDQNNNKTEDCFQNWSGTIWINIERDLYNYSTLTDIEANDIISGPLELLNNYPNPFDSNTTISYIIPKEGIVKLKIYNSTGIVVKTLVYEHQTPGQYDVIYIPHDMPTGAYFYTLQFESFTVTKKMILVK